ncbi:hypothetical protein E2C01_044452 [Portunus trituberculatus]|uniref:Uncharacterized protein n=1 Tax=Portunus trituberculatus TaxID=210409 RepID=A0A5B7G039_PORTR|nr:hypothetical protein [Portunus trituberculatus]
MKTKEEKDLRVLIQENLNPEKHISFELSGSQTDLQASLESIGSPEKINVAEIDPESVRHELRALMTQMNQVELERVRWLGKRRTRGLLWEN